jgi:hypothetical protein
MRDKSCDIKPCPDYKEDVNEMLVSNAIRDYIEDERNRLTTDPHSVMRANNTRTRRKK